MKTTAQYFRKGCVKYVRYLLSVSLMIPIVGPANNASVVLATPRSTFDLDAFLSDFTPHKNSTIIAPSHSTTSHGVETVTSTQPPTSFARQGPSDEASSQWHGKFHEDVSNESESNSTFLIWRANGDQVKEGGRDFSEYNEKWRQYVLLAREEAKCLHEFGSFQPRTDLTLKSESFGPTVCIPGLPNFDNCDICVNLTTSVPTQGACKDRCGSKATCIARCLRIVESINADLKTFTSSEKAEGPHDLDESLVASDAVQKYRESHLQLLPEVFCEGVVLPQSFSFPSGSNNASQPGRHFVYIKIQLKEPKNIVNTSIAYTHNDTCHNCNMDTSNKSNALGPLIFLFQQRHVLNYSNLTGNESSKPTWSNWITLGKTPYSFDEIQVTYSQRTYQWKVTTVSSSGIIAAATLPPFTTLNGYVEPGPPTRVSIVDTKVDADDNVNVLIAWEPPPERACFFKIVLESQMGDERPRTVRIKDVPLGVHQIWFKNLRFDKPYGVRITSRGAGWHGDESTQATLYFTTPSCLLVHNYSFDKCPPSPPSNLTYTVEHMTAAQIELLVSPPSNRKNGLFMVNVSWKPPLYATDDNPVREYIVDVAVLGLGLHAVEKNFTEMPSAPFTIAGNITETRLDGLRGNVEYTILISAKSHKGSSVPAKLTVKIDDGLDVLIPEHQHDWIYPSMAFVAVVLIAFVCQIGRNIFHKWKIKVARDSYFKSIEERDAMEHEWSILPMNEQYSAWKILDENLPGKKWNIGFQNLIMGDIIGQGAFGIVRRAKIKRSKYLELWQKQINTQPNVPETSGDEGEQYETVAVKMLKAVSCTSVDRDDLIKEIVTMQSLGSHPNIVSLLGACTTGRLICLVMEYCPGGDLLSFLRKVREKFLPLLNVTCMSRRSSCCTTWSPTASERSELTRSEKETEEEISEGSPKVECKTSEENIALEDSSSDDTLQEAPIDEGDVLSYARQVALGMAYLERNHIIHRDLACRNILVMGDYKVVKISDFGLSRDIYTWNVYHQKSDGKLPFKWMALESISSHLFTSKSDVWSYGILLWELVTLGGNPYPALGNQELYNMLKSGYRMERPENCSEELYAIMRKCWRSAPSDRPNFVELRRHLEAMIDSSEPKAYLSLQLDVAKERFSSSTRSDLPEVRDHLLPYTSSGGMIGGPSVLPRQSHSYKSTIQTLQDDRQPQYYNLNRRDDLSQWHSDSDPEDDIIVQSGALPTSNEASTSSSYVQQEKRRNTFPLFRTRIGKSEQPPSRNKFFGSKNFLSHVFPRLLKTSQSSVNMSLKKSKLARHRHKRQWQFKKPKKGALGDTNTNFVDKGANSRSIRYIRGSGNQKMAVNCIYGLKLQETIN